MKRRKKSGGSGKKPETIIEHDIAKMLRVEGWHVMHTVGNMFQSGFPDIFACHSSFGHRWIEVKRPDGKSRIESSQMISFPKLTANESGVWILVSATIHEYKKLFAPANWHTYIKY